MHAASLNGKRPTLLELMKLVATCSFLRYFCIVHRFRLHLTINEVISAFQIRERKQVGNIKKYLYANLIRTLSQVRIFSYQEKATSLYLSSDGSVKQTSQTLL